jgi:hypothetical protein
MGNKLIAGLALGLAALLPCVAQATSQTKPSETVQANSRIFGHVLRFSDGDPMGNIAVWARRITADEKKGILSGRDLTYHRTKTGIDGKYVLRGLKPGHYVVFLFKGEFNKPFAWAKDYVALNQEVDVPGGGFRRSDFLLFKGSLVEGRVTSKHTGKPITGQYIGLRDHQGTYYYGITDARGFFRIRTVGGEQHVWLHRNSVSPPKGFMVPAENEFNFTVEDGKTYKINFQLRSAPT